MKKQSTLPESYPTDVRINNNARDPGCFVKGCSAFIGLAIYSAILVAIGWGIRGCSDNKKEKDKTQVVAPSLNNTLGVMDLSRQR